MQLDDLLGNEALEKYADWLAWLREKEAYFEAQLEKLEKRKRQAEETAEPARPASGASYFDVVFGKREKTPDITDAETAPVQPTEQVPDVQDDVHPSETEPVTVSDEDMEPEAQESMLKPSASRLEAEGEEEILT